VAPQGQVPSPRALVSGSVPRRGDSAYNPPMLFSPSKGVPMVSRVVTGAAVAALTVSLAACRGDAPQPESQSQTPAAGAPAADASHAGHTGGRVFFVSPKNGDTIKPSHRFEFGSDMFTIAKVPEGEITEAQVRPGLGHYHLGLDVDCVKPGEVIPRGNPTWIHFGQGNSFIDMQDLTPGQHKYALQAGDDLHRGVEGLCETITVTVAP
jgi:hypothetical protein